jgi:putative ABC transport system permease protein
MLKEYFSLAFENLKHRGIRSWLTMLGIFIGIAAVVSLISLGNGLQTAITGQFASLSADTLTIQNAQTGFGPPGSTAVRKLTEHDLDIVKSVPGVEVAIPRLLRSVAVEYNKIVGFKYLASMPKEQGDVDFIYRTMNVKTSSGRLLKADDRGAVIIGADFMKKEEFDREVKVGNTITVQGKDFKVIGILEKASTLQINMAAIMSEDDMKNILNISDEIDIIIARVVNKDRTAEVAELIANRMRRDRNEKVGEEDFSVQTPVQALQSVNTILSILNIIITGIATISLIIGGIGIANTMYTSVLERMKEIGIMKAVGGKNSDILKIFVIESGLLGLVGGIVGAIIGLGFAFLVSAIASQFLGENIIDVTISYPLLFMAISFAFLIGLVAGILPALQASRLKPVAALRG